MLSTNSLVCLVLLKRLFCFVNIIGLATNKPEGYRLEDRVQLHLFVLTKHYFRKPVKTDVTLLILLFLCILPRSSSSVVRENNNRYHSSLGKRAISKDIKGEVCFGSEKLATVRSFVTPVVWAGWRACQTSSDSSAVSCARAGQLRDHCCQMPECYLCVCQLKVTSEIESLEELIIYCKSSRAR